MFKFKKAFPSIVGGILAAALAITGTVAYLTAEDSDVNVMTVGNVKIEQIEQEWNEEQTALVDFTQAKPLLPYVGSFGWENTEDDGGAYRRFTMNNVADKYVSVKNTGASDAYVRTFIALEMGDYTYEEFNMIGLSVNKINGDEFKFDGAWEWTDDFVAEIEGKNYNVMVAVHKDAVAPGETTVPSLLQVYLSKEATNETVKKLDGNGNGTYDILVASQAVQVEGFADADTALNTAFGDPADPTRYHPWADTRIQWPGVLYSAADAYEATLASGSYTLGVDYKTSETEKAYNANRQYALTGAREVTIDLNGHTVEHDTAYNGYTYLYTVAHNSTLTINGDGTVKSANLYDDGQMDNEGQAEGNCIIYTQSTGTAIINGGDYIVEEGVAAWAGNGSHIVINGGSFVSSGEGTFELIYSSGGVIDIYDGFFHNQKQPNRPVNVANANRGTGYINIYGGTFVGFDPSTGGDDPSNIRVADGYKVVSATQANGDIWYTVVPE